MKSYLSYEAADHLDKKEKQDQGSFYTPENISKRMAKKLFEGLTKKEIASKIILDPTCGKGNLFVACLELGALEENLYGVDIDKEAIKFCIDKFPDGNFQVGNCLEDDITDDTFWTKKWDEKYVPSFRSMFGKV
jgi:predicted RNA methylase